jgi:hypothetical protein
MTFTYDVQPAEPDAKEKLVSVPPQDAVYRYRLGIAAALLVESPEFLPASGTSPCSEES